MKEINSYSSPFNFGHKALQALFDGRVAVQEKVDGSQISFMLDGKDLYIRSRKAMVNPEDAGMFKEAADVIRGLSLRDGFKYRGEYLQKPKHNTISYARVPKNHIILFDVDKAEQDYMPYDELCCEGELLGLEVVPQYTILEEKPTIDQLDAFLENDSILGGAKIEGIVLKNYDQFGIDKKTLMAKYVNEKFKEKHAGDWKTRNPSANDIIDLLISEYSTEARWRKAIQHLKESGKIQGVVQDIPVLMKEVAQDIKGEAEEEIRERLFKHFWGGISRGVVRGLPEFYKRYLIEEALGEQDPTKE